VVSITLISRVRHITNRLNRSVADEASANLAAEIHKSPTAETNKRNHSDEGKQEHLKTYLYISDAKVDMYYAQISSRQREAIARKLGLDVKAALYPAVHSDHPEEARFTRLAIVCQYLEANDVGSLESPSRYFRGVMPMKLARCPRTPTGPFEVAFFIGQTPNGDFVALGGSAHHLLQQISEHKWQNSGVASLLEALAQESIEGRDGSSYSAHRLPGAWPDEAHQIWREHSDPEQLVEFLAVEFARSDEYHPVLLGSPIYVALAS
jgi:hypothetical protein